MPPRAETRAEPGEEMFSTHFWREVACSTGRIKTLKEKIGSRSYMDPTLVEITYSLFNEGKVFYDLDDIDGSIDRAIGIARDIDNATKAKEREMQRSP